jgi:hypothetical protein
MFGVFIVYRPPKLFSSTKSEMVAKLKPPPPNSPLFLGGQLSKKKY